MRNSIRAYAPAFLAILVLSTLNACATFGIAEPQSIDQRIAYTVSQVTAVRSATARAVANDTVSAEDGQKVLKMTDDAKALCDGARAALSAGDPKTAESRVLLATSVLAALREFLGRKQP